MYKSLKMSNLILFYDESRVSTQSFEQHRWEVWCLCVCLSFVTHTVEIHNTWILYISWVALTKNTCTSIVFGQRTVTRNWMCQEDSKTNCKTPATIELLTTFAGRKWLYLRSKFSLS